MPKQVTVTTYTYDELSDAAKEKARAWWREVTQHDTWALDHVIDDAMAVGGQLGIEFDTRRPGRAIYYSVGFRPDDGVGFEGTYYARENCETAVKELAPADDGLAAIAARLDAVRARDARAVHAVVRQINSRYCHENAVSIDCEYDGGEDVPADVAQEVADCLRDYMRWIYRRLVAEITYQDGDEAVGENLRANEYAFTADGRRFVAVPA